MAVGAASARSERTQRRILDAAGLCFAEVGYSKTTVEDIAGRASVSKALVYIHFDGKEDLLERVLEGTLADWQGHTQSCMAAAGASVPLQLRAMHRSSIEYALSHPVLKGIMTQDDRLLLMHVHEPSRKGQEEWRAGLIEIIQLGIQRGELNKDLDPATTADVICLLHLAYLDRLFDNDSPNTGDPNLVEAGMDALLGGIACGRGTK